MQTPKHLEIGAARPHCGRFECQAGPGGKVLGRPWQWKDGLRKAAIAAPHAPVFPLLRAAGETGKAAAQTAIYPPNPGIFRCRRRLAIGRFLP
jgi:hypothetical protein